MSFLLPMNLGICAPTICTPQGHCYVCTCIPTSHSSIAAGWSGLFSGCVAPYFFGIPALQSQSLDFILISEGRPVLNTHHGRTCDLSLGGKGGSVDVQTCPNFYLLWIRHNAGAVLQGHELAVTWLICNCIFRQTVRSYLHLGHHIIHLVFVWHPEFLFATCILPF